MSAHWVRCASEVEMLKSGRRKLLDATPQLFQYVLKGAKNASTREDTSYFLIP
jgi:hypothetical protein